MKRIRSVIGRDLNKMLPISKKGVYMPHLAWRHVAYRLSPERQTGQHPFTNMSVCVIFTTYIVSLMVTFPVNDERVRSFTKLKPPKTKLALAHVCLLTKFLIFPYPCLSFAKIIRQNIYALHFEKSLQNLSKKFDSLSDFLTTQLFSIGTRMV